MLLEKGIQSNDSKTDENQGRTYLTDPTRILALRKNILLVSVVEIPSGRITNHHNHKAISPGSICCSDLFGIFPHELRENSRQVQFNWYHSRLTQTDWKLDHLGYHISETNSTRQHLTDETTAIFFVKIDSAIAVFRQEWKREQTCCSRKSVWNLKLNDEYNFDSKRP